MGFWHTGYMDHVEPFDHRSLAPVSVPKLYQCQSCDAEYKTFEELLTHRLEQHPSKRPVLFIRGQELGSTPFVITSQITTSDIRVKNCDKTVVNGINIGVSKLGQQLSKYVNDLVIVELESDGVPATFELKFSIAKEADIIGVEHCFQNMAGTKRLDVHGIEYFIEASGAYRTAESYCDGICQYLYGVLIKERELTIDKVDHSTKFQQAAVVLDGYDRALAHAIRSLVAFHFNHFTEASAILPESVIGIASRCLNKLIGGDLELGTPILSRKDEKRTNLIYYLSDLDTMRILAIMMNESLTEQADDIEIMMGQTSMTDYDLSKLRILNIYCMVTLEQYEDAIAEARRLRHIPAFSSGIEKLINSIEKRKGK